MLSRRCTHRLPFTSLTFFTSFCCFASCTKLPTSFRSTMCVPTFPQALSLPPARSIEVTRIPKYFFRVEKLMKRVQRLALSNIQEQSTLQLAVKLLQTAPFFGSSQVKRGGTIDRNFRRCSLLRLSLNFFFSYLKSRIVVFKAFMLEYTKIRLFLSF